MVTVILLVAGAVQLVLVAKVIDLWRAVTGENDQSTEGILQRLQQFRAESLAGLDCDVRIVRVVWELVPAGDLAIEEVAHEERPGEPNGP